MELTNEMEIYIEKIIDRDDIYGYKEMPREIAIEIIISNALAKFQQTVYPDKKD